MASGVPGIVCPFVPTSERDGPCKLDLAPSDALAPNVSIGVVEKAVSAIRVIMKSFFIAVCFMILHIFLTYSHIR